MKYFFNFFDKLLDILKEIACFILMGITILVTVDVFLRYVLNRPLSFTLPISELGIIMIVSCGTVWLQKEDGHIYIDIIFSRLKPKQKVFLNIVNSFISSIVLLAIGFFSIPVIKDFYKMKVVFYSTAAVIPSYIYLLPLCICYYLFSIQYLRRAFQNLDIWFKDCKN